MAGIHYDGNFDKEKKQLNNLDESLSAELTAIDQILDRMNGYWKDEKSAGFLSGVKEGVQELKTMKSEAIENGKGALNQIEADLRIYVE